MIVKHVSGFRQTRFSLSASVKFMSYRALRTWSKRAICLMLQQHVFPLASGFPTPAERVMERERAGAGSVVLSVLLYSLFLFTPGCLAGLSVALGRAYGLSVYRFMVSWLFFWVTALLTLDPFVVRYRAQLSDLLHYWDRVLPCTKTCLTVSFDHGFLYYAMLWALSYAFVFVEAILNLFWGFVPAIDVTTFVFGTCLVVFLVAWIGRLVRQHSHIAYSNQRDPPLNADRFVEVRLNDKSTTSTLHHHKPHAPTPTAAALSALHAPHAPPRGAHPHDPAVPDPAFPDHIALHSHSRDRHHHHHHHGQPLGSANPQPGKQMSADGGSKWDASASAAAGSGSVWVRLSTQPRLDLAPSVQLSSGARLDLTDHLERNAQQVTISGNVVTVETLDAAQRGYNCYRAMMWVLLTLLGGFVLVLVLRSSFGLFPLDAWVEYVAMATFVGGVLLLVWCFGRQFADPTYLQFFMLLSTFFPTIYGSWILTIYGNSANHDPDSSSATLIMLLHLVMSDVYLMLTELIVRHFSAPYLYARFMMLPQTMAYLFEVCIFGLSPWSAQYFLVLLFSSAHNIASSTGLYWDLIYYVKDRLFPPDPLAQLNERMRRRSAERRLFEHLLSTRYTMQLFAQDAIADVWSFVTVITTASIVYAFGIPISEIMPSFTPAPIFLRIAALLVARLLSWLCGQVIFRYKLQRLSDAADLDAAIAAADPEHAPAPVEKALPVSGAGGKTLAERLDEYLTDLGLSVFQTAELRTCYEDDFLELFTPPVREGGIAENAADRVDPNKLTLRELMVMQIAERQWLLHPALLRKHFLYWQASMWLLLFIVFQAASQNLPLRYALYKAS
jgi:hypothetical protein